MRRRILIVDDERNIRKVLQAHLHRDGFDVDTAENGAIALEKLKEDTFDLVVTDLRMPEMDGMELLAACRQGWPGLPVILITAHGTVDSAVEAIKAGAYDYVTKPFDRDELRQVIGTALRTEERDRGRLHEDASGRFRIIGQTPSMFSIYSMIEKVAPSPTTVLIAGESGTGKELVARALHDNSDRAAKPFIQVNCGAIPDQLFESELFGYQKGAFTGAASNKLGRFELADGGTLFLDEIGELPKEMQVKLLRILQDGVFERVGGVSSIKVDVRLIAATNRDLREEVEAGRFRKDLYYRLNVIPMRLPPLRDRADDIPLLVEHFLEKFNRRLDKGVSGVSPDAMAALLRHAWPGNIRELENLMERAVLLSDSDVLCLGDLAGLEGADEAPPPAEADASTESLGLKAYVRVFTARLERVRIQRVLRDEGGNVTRAARKLEISRKSLQTKMKEYGLRDEEGGARPSGSDEDGPTWDATYDDEDGDP
jgi:two-component system, NtrC family, response regulator AtoC